MLWHHGVCQRGERNVNLFKSKSIPFISKINSLFVFFFDLVFSTLRHWVLLCIFHSFPWIPVLTKFSWFFLSPFWVHYPRKQKMVLEGFCNILLIDESFHHYWNQNIEPFDLHSVIGCFYDNIFYTIAQWETGDRTNILTWPIFKKNATDSVLKIKLRSLVCILASIWLLCISEIVGLEKFLEIV